MNILVLRPATILCVIVAALLAAASEVSSQDAPPLPEDKVAAADVPGMENQRDVHQRKQQSAVAGLLVLGLLCGVFLFLILVVVFWARRIRLEATQPLPEQQPGDPLWYLRNSSAVYGTPKSDHESDETELPH